MVLGNFIHEKKSYYNDNKDLYIFDFIFPELSWLWKRVDKNAFQTCEGPKQNLGVGESTCALAFSY